MDRSRCFVVILVLVLCCAWLSARSLAVEDFHADITILPSGDIEVAEALKFRFDGSWNGVFRFIPVEYRSPRGFNYRLRIELQSVTDEAGNPLRHEAFREGHYLKFKVWVPGASDTTKTVKYRYLARRALRFLEEHDELYWNVTGDESGIPHEASSATVVLPETATGVRVAAFTGPHGSRESAAETGIQGNRVEVRATRVLGIREGLTLAVAWDPGVVHRPTAWEQAGFFLSDNWFFLVPFGVFALMYLLWSKRGRDPRLEPIVARFEPPEDLSAAEVGTLIDHRPDLRDISATLVDLAVRGYLHIEELDKGDDERDYRLTSLKRGGWPSLQAHEREILEGLFSGGKSTVKISDLKNKFYSKLPGIKKALFESLIAKRYYVRRPDRVRLRYILLALGVALLSFVLGASEALGLSPVSVIVPGLISALIVFVFAWIMPARTVAGARKLGEIKGLEEFLERVESDRYKRMITGPEQFERLLPFAMALKMEDQWAAAFSEIYREPPQWYSGAHPATFRPNNLVSGLNTMSKSAASAMVSAPRSSGGSGFSGGGFSSGGFSGGGFGGGGSGGF